MAQLRAVWVEAKLARLVPSDMTLAEFRKTFDIFKLNANTTNSYQPEEYRGRITLFSAEEDQGQYIFSKNAELLELRELEVKDPLKGWGELATEGVDLRVVPGDHFSMMREPHVSVLAEQLLTCIHESFALPQLK